ERRRCARAASARRGARARARAAWTRRGAQARAAWTWRGARGLPRCLDAARRAGGVVDSGAGRAREGPGSDGRRPGRGASRAEQRRRLWLAEQRSGFFDREMATNSSSADKIGSIRREISVVVRMSAYFSIPDGLPKTYCRRTILSPIVVDVNSYGLMQLVNHIADHFLWGSKQYISLWRESEHDDDVRFPIKSDEQLLQWIEMNLDKGVSKWGCKWKRKCKWGCIGKCKWKCKCKWGCKGKGKGKKRTRYGKGNKGRETCSMSCTNLVPDCPACKLTVTGLAAV
ncbi:hypothetical protein EJB05_38862, partial [Eragrostis curvula]